MNDKLLLSSCLGLFNLSDTSFIEMRDPPRGLSIFTYPQYEKPKSKGKKSAWKERIKNFKNT